MGYCIRYVLTDNATALVEFALSGCFCLKNVLISLRAKQNKQLVLGKTNLSRIPLHGAATWRI